MSKTVVQVEIAASDCGFDLDLMIKKFNKKVRKVSLMETYMDKRFYRSKSRIKHDINLKHKKIRQLEKRNQNPKTQTRSEE